MMFYDNELDSMDTDMLDYWIDDNITNCSKVNTEKREKKQNNMNKYYTNNKNNNMDKYYTNNKKKYINKKNKQNFPNKSRIYFNKKLNII